MTSLELLYVAHSRGYTQALKHSTSCTLDTLIEYNNRLFWFIICYIALYNWPFDSLSLFP